jgi:fungal STAND N-terminal Goodbye domain
MSSTTTTLSNFSSILDAALDSYAKQTRIDLTNHPFADKLQNCRSPDDILQILSERESAFKDYRDKYRNLIDRVRPIVQVVHAFSDVLGEAAGLVGQSESSLHDVLAPTIRPLEATTPTSHIRVAIDYYSVYSMISTAP